jgi:hypothetical protein
MHLRNRNTGAELMTHGLATPPFGPGFPPPLLADADGVECWVSDVNDPENTTEWRPWRDHAIIAQKAVSGY